MPNKSLSSLISLSKEQLAASLELTEESPSPKDTTSWLEYSPEGLENALFHVCEDLTDILENMERGQKGKAKLHTVLVKLINLQAV